MSKPIIGEQPDTKAAIIFISIFITSVHYFKISKLGAIKNHIARIFGKDQAPHLSTKFTFEKMAGFFLNLDNNNQLTFLLDHGFDAEQMKMPDVPDWEYYGEVFGMKDWEDGYTMDDVRMVVSPTYVNEWDIFPHALIWIRKFLLYANNNSIEDVEYKGDRFGNYQNWADYFAQLPIDKKEQLAKTLLTYS